MELLEPIGLQLATVRSCSKINYGVNAPISIGLITGLHYFDVVNIDKYDVVIGTPYMRCHGLKLDFNSNIVDVQGTQILNRFHMSLKPEKSVNKLMQSTTTKPSRSAFKTSIDPK